MDIMDIRDCLSLSLVSIASYYASGKCIMSFIQSGMTLINCSVQHPNVSTPPNIFLPVLR